MSNAYEELREIIEEVYRDGTSLPAYKIDLVWSLLLRAEGDLYNAGYEGAMKDVALEKGDE